MRPYLHFNETGFSLLEIMISMIILTMGVLGLAPLLMLSVEANNVGRDYAIASELAKEELENYQNAGVTALALPHTVSSAGLKGGYDMTTYISDVTTDSLVPNDMAKIEIVVQWNDADGRDRSLRYSTLMSKG